VQKSGEIDRVNMLKNNVEAQLEREKTGRQEAENRVLDVSQQLSKIVAEQKQSVQEYQDKVRKLEFQVETSQHLQKEHEAKIHGTCIIFHC
jgi:uncharacterized coiled-coil protein SlyX